MPTVAVTKLASAPSASTSSTNTNSSSSWLPSVAQAQAAAIDELKIALRTPDSLQRLPALISEYSRQRLESMNALSHVIRSQIDETQLGIETLKKSSEMIGSVREQFEAIDKQCLHVRTLLDNNHSYPIITKVNTARKNIEATRKLLSKLRTLEDERDRLIQELDENERSIKYVYKQLRRLMRLRDSAFSERSDSQFSEKFAEQLNEKFDVMLEVADELELRLWENIADCTILAKDDPTILIRSLEVIEMEDAAKRKVFEASSANGETMRSKVFQTLESTIADAFAHLHRDEEQTKRDKLEKEKQKKAAKKANNDDSDSDSEASEESTLDEATAAAVNPDGRSDFLCEVLLHMEVLLTELDEFMLELAPCFPPDYKITEFYESRYRHWFKVTIYFHIIDLKRLSKKALLKTVQWIQAYSDRLGSKNLWNAADGQQFDQLMANLVNAFCVATEETLTRLVDNILKVEANAEPEMDAEGHYTTSGPADLFFTVNQQVDIVLHSFGLKAKALVPICLMISDLFNYYQKAQLKFLSVVTLDGDILRFGEAQVEKSDTFFAAIINNCHQCSDHLDELKEKCVQKIAHDDIPGPRITSNAIGATTLQALAKEVENKFEDCSDGFVTVASEAIDILVLQIMATLRKALNPFFSPAWMKDNSLSADVTSTLTDFFNDYRAWIARDAYFGQIVKNTLHSFVREYVYKLIDAHPTLSTELLGRVREDRLMLDRYFMQYANLITEHTVTNELMVLQLIEEIVHCDVDFLKMHFNTIRVAFGSQSVTIFEGLLSILRADFSRSQRKQLLEAFSAQKSAT